MNNDTPADAMKLKPVDIKDFGDAIDPNAAHNRRKYRKTALIEATQWWQMGDHPAVREYNDIDGTGNLVAWVDTLEGGHKVTPGDWIATGVHGEHWPIKPDIFAKTYEPVDDTRTTSLAAQDGLVYLLKQAVRAAEIHYNDGEWDAVMPMEEWLEKSKAALASIEVKS